MSDKRTPGSNPRGGPLKSQAWNRVVESSDDYHRRRAQGAVQPALPSSRNWHTVIQLRNDCGVNLRRGELLELDGYTLATLDNNDLWFSGVDPDLTHIGWAIAIEPIASNASSPEIGPACVLGVCVAHVQFIDPDHKYAKRVSGQRVLNSVATAAEGPVKILHVGAEGDTTDEFECVVQIMDEQGGGETGLYFATEQTSGSPERSSPEVDTAENYLIDPHDGEFSTVKFADMLIHGPPDAIGDMGSPVSGRVLNYYPFGFHIDPGAYTHALEVIKTGDVYIVRKPLLSRRQPYGRLEISRTFSSYTSGSTFEDPDTVVAVGHSIFSTVDPITGSPYYVKYLPKGYVRYRVYGFISWSWTQLATFRIPQIYLDQIDIVTLQGANTPLALIELSGTPANTYLRKANGDDTRSFSGVIEVDSSAGTGIADPDQIQLQLTNLPSLTSSGTLQVDAQVNFDPIW